MAADGTHEERSRRAPERDALEEAEREHRWRTTEETLHVNAATGEMISPNGHVDDETIAAFEHRLREALS